MNIFNRNTKRKHLEKLELKIAELLSDDFPELKKVINMSPLYGISFTEKPQGIYLTRSYSPEAYEEIKRNHNTSFDLKGLYVFDKTVKKHIPLKLNYLYDSLTMIEIGNPKQFHKTFDLNDIKAGEIEIKHLKLDNPDKETVLKILNNSNQETISLLDLESTFEIEIDGKSFFTILDMEDGNYVAIDQQGKVYRLNHDSTERVKEISGNVEDFLKIYKGSKSEIEKIMFKKNNHRFID